MIRAVRTLLSVLALAVVIAVAVYFAGHPGRVEVVWQGWQVGTSVGILIAAAALAGLLVALLAWIVSLIVGAPRAITRFRRERRRGAGYRALTRGMVAVAAGDPHEAKRYARRADSLLADPPLTLLLSAQAAQLEGDHEAARKFFTAMLDRPETEFLGLRGLLNQALRRGDRGAALGIAKRAMALRPSTPWVVEGLLDLETREGQWLAAEKTLAQAVKKQVVPRDRARHNRGVILYELGLAALARGDRRRGINLAAEAQSLVPDLAAPAAHYVRLLLEDGRTGQAAKIIERAWRTAPHPELAQAYSAIGSGAALLARVKSFERLAAQNPTARESHLTVAEAALEAQLWGEARRHLEQALDAATPPPMSKSRNPIQSPSTPAVAEGDEGLVGPTPRLCLMMARLEEAEHGSEGAMREWLDRAITAMPDPRYICTICLGESLEWRSLCPHCSNFDSLAWRTPAWVAPGRTLPVVSRLSKAETHEVSVGSLRTAELASLGDGRDGRAPKP